jgi:hypothetical protein
VVEVEDMHAKMVRAEISSDTYDKIDARDFSKDLNAYVGLYLLRLERERVFFCVTDVETGA